MKLKFSKFSGCWELGEVFLHCGTHVLIDFISASGVKFQVFGRFEIQGDNNPVFYTSHGRFAPDLSDCEIHPIGRDGKAKQ